MPSKIPNNHSPILFLPPNCATHESVLWMRQEGNGSLCQCAAQLGNPVSHTYFHFPLKGKSLAKKFSLAAEHYHFERGMMQVKLTCFSYSHQCDLIFVCSNSVLELLCWKAVLLQRLYSLGISSLEKLYLSLIQRADFLVLS